MSAFDPSFGHSLWRPLLNNALVRRKRIRPPIGRPYRFTSLAPLTRDDAAVVIIGRDACPALANRLLPGISSVGCGQGRKGGAEDDCRGKCDLFRIGHCPISFVLLRLCTHLLRAGDLTSHLATPIKSTLWTLPNVHC